MKIALAQMNCVVGDLGENTRKAIEFYLKAEKAGCDLCVFPEMTLTGYPPEDLLFRRAYIEAAEAALGAFAKQTGNCGALIGLPLISDDNHETPPYNGVVFCRHGETGYEYHKQMLPNYGVFDEVRYFSVGGPIQDLMDLDDRLLGVSICEDIWLPTVPGYQKATGATMLINLSASPYSALRLNDREELLTRLASELDVPIVYCNMVGGQDELVFDGGSMAVSPSGVVCARARQFEEDLLIFDTTLPAARVEPTLPHLAEVYEALVTGTRDYVRKNGFDKVVIGLSGGIDSALVASIASDAIGPENVTGIMMPSKFSSEGSITDARALAEALGIYAVKMPITALHEAALNTGVCKALCLADENIQARLRGMLVMGWSNNTPGTLVLTTGNKSEMAMGYATLYGDMAGGFAVIKDVPKTLVFALCRWLNDAVESRIPLAIIEKPPSAELRPNQRDTDSLPDYDTLDAIIHLYVNEDATVEEILQDTGIDRSIVTRVAGTIDRNEYKRRQAPPGVRISMKAFGRDRRLPISNGWKYE